MRLRQLEFFIKIVECGSVTRAANELYVSQPNLTKAINVLEQQYDVKLFERKGRGIELTLEGKEFLKQAKNVVAAAQALDNNFNCSDKGLVRLFIATQQFDFIYRTLHQTYVENIEHKILYNLVETDRDEIIKLVLKADVDMGLLVLSEFDSRSFLWTSEKNRLDIEIIDTAPVYACVGPMSPLYGLECVPIEQAVNLPHIFLDMEPQAKSDVSQESYFKSKGNLKKLFFNSTRACEYFLLHTDGLMFASKWTLGCFEHTDIRTIKITYPKNYPPHLNKLAYIKRLGDPLSKIEEQFITKIKAGLNRG